MNLEVNQQKDLAYYYSEWIWPSASSDHMKSLLLFFDGLALALPPDLAARVIDQDPILAQPLADQGLLANFDPGEWLDREEAELLIESLLELLHDSDGRFWRSGERFMRITPTHWGSDFAPEAATVLLEELKRLGLATPLQGEGGLVSMHPGVRLLVLIMFIGALESSVRRRSTNTRLQPTTDNANLAQDHVTALKEYLNVDNYLTSIGDPNPRRGYSRSPARATIITHDLLAVGVDLSSVPLDEVLDFRREQGRHYRAYARSLRQFLVESQVLMGQDHEDVLIQRQQEIADMAASIRQEGRKAFAQTSVMLSLSLAGAAWTAIGGDPIGSALAAFSAVVAAKGHETAVSSYSYLFQMRNLPGVAMRSRIK